MVNFAQSIEPYKEKKKRLKLVIKLLKISKREQEFTLEMTKKRLKESQEELSKLGDFP